MIENEKMTRTVEHLQNMTNETYLNMYWIRVCIIPIVEVDIVRWILEK